MKKRKKKKKKSKNIFYFIKAVKVSMTDGELRQISVFLLYCFIEILRIPA